LIAAGNSKLPDLLPAVRTLLNDPSEMVREAASWAETEINS